MMVKIKNQEFVVNATEEQIALFNLNTKFVYEIIRVNNKWSSYRVTVVDSNNIPLHAVECLGKSAKNGFADCLACLKDIDF